MSSEASDAAELSGEHTVAPVVLPYCDIVSQHTLRRALEIAFVAPSVGGVLATGQRGTAKSTTVRAFARMIHNQLPVTLPIGATDDRILGGWQVEDLMHSQAKWRDGLIWEAGSGSGPGMLYVDEVNLLEDHLTNLILDVASTGILTVQRDGAAKEPRKVQFSLIGTMNPEEGGLRPQLLDRFGLVVTIESIPSPSERKAILETVLRFEREAQEPDQSLYLAERYRLDHGKRTELRTARERLGRVEIPSDVISMTATIASRLQAEGHRGELATLRAARAAAAIDGSATVTASHLAEAARMALIHRRAPSDSGTVLRWSEADERILQEVIGIEAI